MFAAQLAPVLMRRGIHYGWVMVVLTFLVTLCVSGALGMLGALLLPVQRELGWEASAISGALALRLLLFGLIAPFAAALLARYGLRRIIGLAMVLGITGCLLSMAVSAPWQLWLCWGLLVGLGTGLAAQVLGAMVANRWFTERRGLVLGVLTAAGASGQIIFLPLVAWLAQHEGWRVAMLPGVIACACVGVLMALFGADHPGNVGLPPYGEDRIIPPPAPPAGDPVRNALATLTAALPDSGFWILAGSFLICGLSTAGLVQTHFIPLCVEFGMPEVTAASVLAAMGAFNFVGTIASGWLSDRYDPRWLLFWYYGLRGLSLLILPFSDFTVYGLSVFAVFYGLDWIATVPPTVKLVAQRFGREPAPMLYGWIFAGHQLGSAIAAMAGGVSQDQLASVMPAFIAAGFLCLLAAVLVLGFQRPAVAAAA
jgi:MFS family permease